MSVKIIDTLKPKNDGSFPIVEAVDVAVSSDLRLPEALEAKADVTALAEVIGEIADKAGIEDLEALAEQITTPFNFKGTVETEAELPSTAELNDTYFVTELNYRVTWNGSEFAQSSLDESAYEDELTEAKSDLNNLGAELINSNNGIQTFVNLGNFQHYGLNSDGTFKTSQKYRVSTDEAISFDRQLKISVSSGFKWGYIPISGSDIGTWSGWITENHTIPSGLQFFVQIARETDDTSEIADVFEFLSAVTFETTLSTDVTETRGKVSYLENWLVGERNAYSLIGNIERGGITTGGANYNGDTAYRKSHFRTYTYLPNEMEAITITATSPYQFNVWIYQGDNVTSSGWKTSYTIENKTSSSYRIRIAFSRTDDVEFDESDLISNTSIIYGGAYADDTLTISKRASDSKTVGDNFTKIREFIGYEDDITDKLTFYHGKNVYISSSGTLTYSNQTNRSRSDIFQYSKQIKVVPKNGINVTCMIQDSESELWSAYGDIWKVSQFIIPSNTKAILSFKKIDNTDFSGDEELAEVYEVYGSRTTDVPQYRLISDFSQESIISDNDREISAAIQGMCFDGENIWYFITGENVLKKYNIETEAVESYPNLGLGHGNDIAYNPNTGLLYIAVCEGTEPIIKTIDTDTMEVNTITLSEFDGNICGIAYCDELDKFVVVGGSDYNRAGNTSGWTRKLMTVYDSNFDWQKKIRLENDFSAFQGIECDSRYIYFAKSFIISGSHSDRIQFYDYNGLYIGEVSSGSGEVESIAKIDDNNFYIAKCANGYHGGYVYKATVTSETARSVLDVAFGQYQVN